MTRIHSIPGLVAIITLGSLMSSCATPPATADLERRSQLGLDATAILETTKDSLHGRLLLIRHGSDGKELEREVIADIVLSAESLAPRVMLCGEHGYRDVPTSGSETSHREWRDWRETWTLDWRELRGSVHTMAIAMLTNPNGEHSTPASSAYRCSRRECRVGADRLLETYGPRSLRFTRRIRENGTREVSLWCDGKRVAFLRIKATEVLDYSSTSTPGQRHVTFLPCGVGVWPELPRYAPHVARHDLVNSAGIWMDELLLRDYMESNPSEEVIKKLWRLVMTGKIKSHSSYLRRRFNWR